VDHSTLLVGPVRRGNLPAAIADQLRSQIRKGQPGPGEQLPGHRELAAAFSVSVGSVREAISMLVSAGLVETRAGRGTFVAERRHGPELEAGAYRTVAPGPPLERKAVEELIEAREVLEAEIAALAAERATPQQIEELRRRAENMEAAASDPEDYPDADVEFHLALAEAAGNRFLLHAMMDIRALLKQDMELGAEAAIRRFGDLRISVVDHRSLVEAIEARDPEAARTVLSKIVRRNHDFVLGLYALAAPDAHGGGAG
jgi:GntR family transcriptional regulator, transcriptional repressor for pyruvate dehydrogenase complex